MVIKYTSLDGLRRFKEKLIASAIPFSKEGSGMSSENVQDAINENANEISNRYTKTEVDTKVSAIKGIASLESLGLEDYDGTTLEFIDDIRSFDMPAGSMAIGPVCFSDLPGGLGNCEIVVTRIDEYATNLSISSNNRAPYKWFMNHWAGSSSANNVWRTYGENTTADDVTFDDGDTFQDKYDSGELNGADFPYETLTQIEYDALTTKEDKLYIITEEVE